MRFFNLNRDTFTAESNQQEHVRTIYAKDFTKKNKNFIEENEIFVNQKTRNSDICYFRDILTQYKTKKHGYFKFSGVNADEDNTEINSRTKFVPRVRPRRKLSREDLNKLKNLEDDLRSAKENIFSHTMDNYYVKLMDLKNKQNYQEMKTKKNITDLNSKEKKPIWENKISAFFGIDQHKDNLKKEDLNIFKNLHGKRIDKQSQDKNGFPNLISRRNTSTSKFETIVRRKTKPDVNLNKLNSSIER